jgi:perosamine synthetase
MIPVFEPIIEEDEIAAVVDALRKGEISGSFGQYIPNFEQAFADYCGVKYGIAVTSGSTALHIAVTAAGIGEGDEVLVSASTNIATALAVIHNNAIPVPIDSEPLTWNLDLDLIESLITPKTKAIIPVHLYGHPVDMDRLMQIAEKYHLIVIEDAAEAHGATCRGKVIGSFGDMSCFSFYANKLITTGEGGMILTDNKEYADKLKLLRNLAFTQPRFWHEEAGFNFRMTGYQAAMGLVQVGKLDRIIADKIKMARLYDKYLAGIKGLQLPYTADWATNVYWMYGIVLNADFGISRDELVQKLRSAGIDTRTFFCPMNIQPCLQKRKGFRQISCPVAENIWENGLYLPSSTHLTEEQIRFVADEIRKLGRN